jgi:hypothetical protein
MAVKRYDGSQWVTVAGKGDQGTSSSIATWVKTASGGETSLSGNDDNSQPLSYTVGQELVFINGALQKRGSDYTATTGNSITGLTALAANDVVTVWTVNAFSVTNAISSGLVTTTGDIIYASAANTPARLGIGSTGQVLKVSGGVPAWGTDSSGGMTLLSTTTMTTDTTTISNIDQTYNSLFITIEGINYPTYASYDVNIDSSTSGFSGITVQANESGSVGTNQTINGRISAQWSGIRITNTNNITMIQIDNYASTTGRKPVYASYGWTGWTGSAEVIRAGWTAGAWLSTSAVDSFQVVMGSTPTAGTIKIYGVK